MVVQSLTALSLVLALPLGALLTNQHIGRRELTGATLTLVGIIFFISAGQPQGGTTHPGAAAWWAACLITAALVLVLFMVGRRFTGASKALVFGAAAGLGYGLQAAVTKTFVTELGGGVLALLSTWSVYVLIISAVSGFALQQSALKTGVLAPAMASSNSVTLFSSVILGIAVYGETLSKTGTGHAGSTIIGLVVAIVGIAFLAGSEGPEAATGAAAVPPTRHRRRDVPAPRADRPGRTQPGGALIRADARGARRRRQLVGVPGPVRRGGGVVGRGALRRRHRARRGRRRRQPGGSQPGARGGSGNGRQARSVA